MESQWNQKHYAIYLPFVLRPFDEIQFDGPNCSKERDLMEESRA